MPALWARSLQGTHHIELTNVKDPSKTVGSLLAWGQPGQINSGFVVDDIEGLLFSHHFNLEENNGNFTIASVETLAYPSRPTSFVEGLVSSRLAGHALWSAGLSEDTLMTRLGEVRFRGVDSVGIWMRTRHGRAGLDEVYGFGMDTHHYQLGYDQDFMSYDGRVLWGGSLSWDEGRADLRRGRARIRSFGAAFYRSQFFESGWYVDVLARIEYQRNKFENPDAGVGAWNGRLGQWGFSISGEAGRRVELGGGLFVQPEAQLTVGRLDDKGLTTSNGVSVETGAVNALVSRIGVKAGLRFADDRGEVHAGADLLREWAGRDTVHTTSRAVEATMPS